MPNIHQLEAKIASDAERAVNGDRDAIKDLRRELRELNHDERQQVAHDLKSGSLKVASILGGVDVETNANGNVTAITFLPSIRERVMNDAHAVSTTFAPVYDRGASPAFFKEIRGYFNQLPAKAAELIDAHYTYLAAHKTGEAAPFLQGTPRGYDKGATYNDVPALTMSDRNQIIFAEYVDGKNHHGPDQRTTNMRDGFFHESGHALDFYVHVSQRPDFRAAYSQDIAHMSAQDKKDLEYYLQRDGAGENETFAELFSVVNGAGGENNSRFRRAFPRTTAVVEAYNRTLK